MGDLQARFESLLASTGHVTRGWLRRPATEDITTHANAAEILEVYRDLGGVQDMPAMRPGAWDVEWEDIGVELDEQLHFNRYRARTLQSPLYRRFKAFPITNYARYCELHESECLAAGSYGKKWSNPSCETQFGPAGEYRNLSSGGAPRWRQRAFYDFLRDLSPILVSTQIARVAIWDEIEENGRCRIVADALRRPSSETAGALTTLVRQRAS